MLYNLKGLILGDKRCSGKPGVRNRTQDPGEQTQIFCQPPYTLVGGGKRVTFDASSEKGPLHKTYPMCLCV